jgi:hypothetical protein
VVVGIELELLDVRKNELRLVMAAMISGSGVMAQFGELVVA